MAAGTTVHAADRSGHTRRVSSYVSHLEAAIDGTVLPTGSVHTTHEGRPLWVGDRRHLSHRLEAMGMSRRTVVLTHYLLAFCAGCPALLLIDLRYKTALVIAETAGILALMAVMELAGRRRPDGG